MMRIADLKLVEGDALAPGKARPQSRQPRPARASERPEWTAPNPTHEKNSAHPAGWAGPDGTQRRLTRHRPRR